MLSKISLYKQKSGKKSKKKYNNKNFDRYIGKVILVKLPNNKKPRYRWIVRKRDDNRYIVRAPKIGILIRELDLKRDSDYNKEVLLPKDAIRY